MLEATAFGISALPELGLSRARSRFGEAHERLEAGPPFPGVLHLHLRLRLVPWGRGRGRPRGESAAQLSEAMPDYQSGSLADSRCQTLCALTVDSTQKLADEKKSFDNQGVRQGALLFGQG